MLFRSLNESGYGMVGTGARGSPNDRAHRITYRHFVGEIPAGMFVLHRCDVRSCCNPSHLFVGTAKDNTHDMIKKGRGSNPPRNLHDHGEYRYNAKLTDSLVSEARLMVREGKTRYAVWKLLDGMLGGYSQKACYRMLNGESWGHV